MTALWLLLAIIGWIVFVLALLGFLAWLDSKHIPPEDYTPYD